MAYPLHCNLDFLYLSGMAVTGFNTALGWNHFTQRASRPGGASEDAHIMVRWNYSYATRGRRVIPTVNIAISTGESWVVRSRRSNDLLQHEQGHYDITAIGARELHNRMSRMTSRNIRTRAARLRRAIQVRINRYMRKYDRQTNHGLNRARQRRWDRRIAAVKRNPNGRLARLP